MRCTLAHAPRDARRTRRRKSTQSAILARQFGIVHVSSGALLREHVATKTEYGRQVSALLDRGELVSDELIFAVVGDVLVTTTNGYILDRLPRTLTQARRAYELAQPADLVADAVIYLDVPDDVARARDVTRSTGRPDCRSAFMVRCPGRSSRSPNYSTELRGESPQSQGAGSSATRLFAAAARFQGTTPVPSMR